MTNRGSILLSFTLRPLFTTLALQKALKVRESTYFELPFSWHLGGRELITSKCKQYETNKQPQKKNNSNHVWIISEWLELTSGKQIMYWMSHLSLVISPILTKWSNFRQSLKAKNIRPTVKWRKMHIIWRWHFYNYYEHWYLWSFLMETVYIEKESICYILYTDPEVKDHEVPSFCLVRDSEGAGLRKLLKIRYRTRL